MIKNIYIYISNCFDPYRNLATEKYLLDTLPEASCILYLWQNQNTVVIGKNQNPWTECRCELMKSESISLARRLSGGGAVFHDLGNLNFTFLCNEEDYDLEKQMKVISVACSFAGIETELSGRNDILADGRKFSGNAFYNSKGKSYHHGTIMICADTQRMSRYLTPPKAKLESKGVKSVKSRVVNLSELSYDLTIESMKGYMISAFEEVYGITSEAWMDTDTEAVSRLADKYGSWEYLYGFNMPFSLSCEGHFNWGHIQLGMNISQGVIKSLKVYTDSMDWSLSERIESSLANCRFELTDIESALKACLSETAARDLYKLLEENCT